MGNFKISISLQKRDGSSIRARNQSAGHSLASDAALPTAQLLRLSRAAQRYVGSRQSTSHAIYNSTGPILNASKFGCAFADTSPYPTGFTNGASGGKTLHAEVLKAIAANHWPSGGIGPTDRDADQTMQIAAGWLCDRFEASFILVVAFLVCPRQRY